MRASHERNVTLRISVTIEVPTHIPEDEVSRYAEEAAERLASSANGRLYEWPASPDHRCTVTSVIVSPL